MTFQLELLTRGRTFFCLAASSALQGNRKEGLSQESSKQSLVACLTRPQESRYLPDSAESHYLCSDTALLITCLTPRTEMDCEIVYVCMLKRDWHSIFRLLKYFLCLACKPKRGRKHKTSTYTHASCIKSMSLESRKVLRLPSLDLQKCGGGAGCVCGREHLGISFYKFTVYKNYLNSTSPWKREGF